MTTIQVTYESGELIEVHKPSKGSSFAVEMDECGCIGVKNIKLTQSTKPEVRKVIALDNRLDIPGSAHPQRSSIAKSQVGYQRNIHAFSG